MNQDTAKKFFLDPEWEKVEEYIYSFFEDTVDVSDIDTDMPSEAVHAEVIARKRIKQALEKMKANFNTLRMNEGKEKTTFR